MDSHASHFLIQSEIGEWIYFLSQHLSPLFFNYFYPEETSTFGQGLRKARMDAGLRAKDLAEMLGVTECTVYNWEVRGIRPSKENQARLEVILEDHLRE
jgi:DNA-binding transcriptional regulator YiaG